MSSWIRVKLFYSCWFSPKISHKINTKNLWKCINSADFIKEIDYLQDKNILHAILFIKLADRYTNRKGAGCSSNMSKERQSSHSQDIYR